MRLLAFLFVLCACCAGPTKNTLPLVDGHTVELCEFEDPIDCE